MTLPIRIKYRSGTLTEILAFSLGGFLSSLALFHGRAPFSIALLAACRGRNPMLSALCGAVLGAIALMDFTAALRHSAILILIYALFAAFEGTKYIAKEFFRPLGAAAMCASVEFAYLLQEGIQAEALLGFLTYLLLIFALSHYCALLFRRRTASAKPDADTTLRKRLELSAAAFRDLYNSFGKPVPKSREENPAVVFDRSAEQVCRGCKQSALCWTQNYVDTFNALNDATPAMLRRGRSVPEDYPAHFQQRCLHLPEFLAAVNQELNALLLRRQYRRRLEAERQRARGQYAQLSEFLGQAAGQLDAIPAGTSSGNCRVGGAWRPKEGESVCGDVITRFHTADGRLCLLLSDGMGSGKEAHREAENTVRLLEQFLKAGVEPEAALRTLCAAMHLKSEDTGSFATIDLLLIDPRQRQASLWKYGAAPTYIKRRGSVRRLTGTALPAGLQDPHAPAASIRFPLEPDTFLLLVSDGLFDPCDDNWLQNFLAGWQGSDPQRLVSVLMAESKKQAGTKDDSSCLCLYVGETESEV